MGIGIRLKIGDEFLRAILSAHDLFTVFKLGGNLKIAAYAVGTRTLSAAKDTALCSEGTVTIWAGKAGIYRDALDFAAKDPLQFSREGIVAFELCHAHRTTGARIFFSERSTQHCSADRTRKNSPVKRNLVSGTGTLMKSLPRPTVNAKPLLPPRSHFSTESVDTVSSPCAPAENLWGLSFSLHGTEELAT